MIPAPQLSSPACVAGKPSSNSNSKPLRPKLLLLAASLAVSLLVLAGLRDTPSLQATSLSGSFAPCVACFAAPIATSTDSSIASESGTTGRGAVILNRADTWDAVSTQNVDAALALLPASVISQLGNPVQGPVYVSVNDQGKMISGSQPYGKAANFFSTDEGWNQVVLYPRQSVRTILHELGHAYSLRHTPGGSYGAAYLDPELRSFMAATSWRLLTPDSQLGSLADQSRVSVALDSPLPWTNLSRNDPLEDFANSFAYYYAAPDQLYELSPARYGWFAAHMPQ